VYRYGVFKPLKEKGFFYGVQIWGDLVYRYGEPPLMSEKPREFFYGVQIWETDSNG
jgi:hypothetical protein